MSTSQARVYRWADLHKDAPLKLLERRQIVGERVMLSQVLLKEGCSVPSHQHENEQFACVLSGRLRFTLGQDGQSSTKELVVEGGQVLHLPSNVAHRADALEDTLVLDVFSPPSEKTGLDRDS